MAKTEVTEQLEKAIRSATSKMGTFSCYEVTIGLGGRERVDYMTYDTKGVWRCYEIKCSLSDFRSKAKKSFYGHYNYYVLTKELYEKVKDEIPKHIGIYVAGAVKRNAKKQELTIPEETFFLSLIRSLSREADKYYFSTTPNVIEMYERRIRHAEQEKKRAIERERELIRMLQNKFGWSWRAELENVEV